MMFILYIIKINLDLDQEIEDDIKCKTFYINIILYIFSKIIS